jgi:adenosylcobinamide-phosphate synthase
MVGVFEQLSTPQYQSLIVIWLVVLTDRLWQLPLAYHPLSLMRMLAENMATRVRPPTNSPQLQHYISGSLGFLVLCVPVCILLYLLISLAEYEIFFDGILLFIALGFGAVRKQYLSICTAIGRHKKLLARERLNQFVARDCATLSEVGIAKAAIESLLLKYYLIFCSVIFWYIIGGSVVALFYRLALEFSWQWHYRRPGFFYFSHPIRKCVKIMSLPPSLLAIVAVWLNTHIGDAWRGLRQSRGKDFTSKRLALFGAGLGITLGGPAIYQGKKYRWPRVGGPRQVRYSDMTYAYRAIRGSAILQLVFYTLAAILWHGL